MFFVAGLNGEAADGLNCVAVGSILRGDTEGGNQPGGLAKLLTNTYDPTSTYQLSVKIARFSDSWAMWGGYKVELLAGGTDEDSHVQYTHKVVGGTVIGQEISTEDIAVDVWNEITVVVDPNPANADLAGEPIQIRLTSLKIPGDPNTTYICVDDVKITTDAPQPLEPVTMTLTVNKQGEAETTSDSVIIDVYDDACDDACEMAKALNPELIDITDHNLDCITDLADLAADWMLDYSLVEPAVRPVD